MYKSCIGCLKEYEQIGFNYYNTSKAVTIQSLEVLPGFFSTLQSVQAGPMMLIDITSKVLTKDSVWPQIQELQRKFNHDKERINMEFRGTTVKTSYGNTHLYKIEKIDFDKTVNDTFDRTEKIDGERKEVTISFKDYYKKTYNKDIKHDNQPLMVASSKGKQQKVYLVPELCEKTGLTDS